MKCDRRLRGPDVLHCHVFGVVIFGLAVLDRRGLHDLSWIRLVVVVHCRFRPPLWGLYGFWSLR